MIESQQVFEITCNPCGAELTPPRAQDYWQWLYEAEQVMAERGWTVELMEVDTDHPRAFHRCNECTCAHQGHLRRKGSRYCDRCWRVIAPEVMEVVRGG